MISPVSSSSQVYAVYFRPSRRSSIGDVRCIQAASLEQANMIANQCVVKQFPDGCVLGVCKAENSAYPLMDAAGNHVAPSKFFPKPKA